MRLLRSGVTACVAALAAAGAAAEGFVSGLAGLLGPADFEATVWMLGLTVPGFTPGGRELAEDDEGGEATPESTGGVVAAGNTCCGGGVSVGITWGGAVVIADGNG